MVTKYVIWERTNKSKDEFPLKLPRLSCLLDHSNYHPLSVITKLRTLSNKRSGNRINIVSVLIESTLFLCQASGNVEFSKCNKRFWLVSHIWETICDAQAVCCAQNLCPNFTESPSLVNGISDQRAPPPPPPKKKKSCQRLQIWVDQSSDQRAPRPSPKN